ncbi:hypothetical protein [Sphingobacterium cellulitidis]|uniref:hypothetical protein n=1 Tax=Sphingobacterium cellulitidis TaxID=1768011 RepID=UPI00211AD87A|nr:hypothetical protein [Sphingobacterium cellulitidis]
MKILIIEDEKDLLQTIEEFLKSENFLIESAMDYNSALEKVMNMIAFSSTSCYQEVVVWIS